MKKKTNKACFGENVLVDYSWTSRCPSLERFSIAFTANGKRQAEISRLPKPREIYLVPAYILPVSHIYGASTKNREIS